MSHKQRVLRYWQSQIDLVLKFAVGATTPSYWMERAVYYADQYCYVQQNWL